MKFLVAVWLHDSDTGGSGTWLARLGWQQQHVWATHSRVLQWYGGHPANCLCRTMSPGPHPHWESVLNVLQFWHTGNILADIGTFLLAYVVFEVYEHLWSVVSDSYFFSTNPLYSFFFLCPSSPTHYFPFANVFSFSHHSMWEGSVTKRLSEWLLILMANTSWPSPLMEKSTLGEMVTEVVLGMETTCQFFCFVWLYFQHNPLLLR